MPSCYKCGRELTEGVECEPSCKAHAKPQAPVGGQKLDESNGPAFRLFLKNIPDPEDRLAVYEHLAEQMGLFIEFNKQSSLYPILKHLL